MSKPRLAIAALYIGLAGCSQDDDEDIIGTCELGSASMRLFTRDAGSIIASATVEGCQATITTKATCDNPMSSIEAYSTSGGGQCTFKIYATNGQAFIASSQLENIKLSPGYKCRGDNGGVYDIDSYLSFSPSLIVVDFGFEDAGNFDVQACTSHDGGIVADVR